jgi:hypothetical protein
MALRLEQLFSGDDHYKGSAVRALLEHAARDGDALALAGPTVSAAGAIDPDQLITYLSVDATKAYTLANGTFVGQIVLVLVIAGTNTPVGSITPATTAPASGATYTSIGALGAVGDFIMFIWNGTGWLRGLNAGITVT